MNSLVLGVLKIGAILLLMSIGIMMIGASLLLLISLAYPGLRNFVPDVGAFVDILGWALRGILSYKTKEEDKFRNRDVEDCILDERSDTTDRPRPGATDMYTEPNPYAPHPEKPKPPHNFYHEPQTKPENPEPCHYDTYPKEPENLKYAPHYTKVEKVEKHKEPHHDELYNPKPHHSPFQLCSMGFGGRSAHRPQLLDENNKIVTFDLIVGQPGDSHRPQLLDEYSKIVTFDLTAQPGDSD